MPDPLNRRDFLGTVAGGAALAVSQTALGQQAKGRQPNVIYAFSDEHRWQSMCFADMPEVKTPNMKRLADEGVSFTNCISNYPVCSPHRAILMTGRWPYQQGVIDNGIRLSPGEMTIGKAFKAAGYATGYVGKWHLGGVRAEPFGFDHSLIWTKTNSHWHSFYHPKGAKRVESTAYNATAMTDQALKFVEGSRETPFFLMLSWNPPHSNFTDAPKEMKALYPEGSLPNRPNMRTKGWPERRQKRHWRMYKGYHAHVTAVDHELGRIMQKLDELGLADNTIVVYSSDHGSMLGSHGVGGKRQPYEESIKTPFIARWPKGIPAGRTDRSLLGTIDIMPSMCALAGAPVPDTCVGQDLSPAMRGQNGPEPESQFIMHISKKHASGGEKHPAPIFRGVTTGRCTYALYPDGPWCLFDNQEDPHQLKNLIDNPDAAETREVLRAMLGRWLKEADDPFVLPT